MSTKAPWLALAIDWQESEMFDGASHGVRLAWVCLLCHVKAQGRAGVAVIRGKAFAERYRLSVESVEELLARAGRAGAIHLEGEVVSVVNWKPYQDPKVRHSKGPQPQPVKRVRNNHRSFSKSAVTTNHPPTTHHPPPAPSIPVANPSAPDPEPLSAAWSEVVVVVRDCGVGNAVAACESARDRGASPSQVRALCEHFAEHPGAWGVGLLYRMIEKIRPEQKPSWPAMDPAYLERQRVASVEQKHQQHDSAVAKQLRERKERQAEREALDAEAAANPYDMASDFKKRIKTCPPNPLAAAE